MHVGCELREFFRIHCQNNKRERDDHGRAVGGTAGRKRVTSPGPGDEEAEAESVVPNVANGGRKIRE